MKVSLLDLNQFERAAFAAVCGGFFEHSPWIAERAWMSRPFRSVDHLHQIMCNIVLEASVDQKVALIRAHPDLVGQLARDGRLTTASTTEQAAAGLDALNPRDTEAFDRYNAEYRAKFGFPFVICARENRKEAILAAFPRRLQNDRDTEIATALTEISRIARLRLCDALLE